MHYILIGPCMVESIRAPAAPLDAACQRTARVAETKSRLGLVFIRMERNQCTVENKKDRSAGCVYCASMRLRADKRCVLPSTSPVH